MKGRGVRLVIKSAQRGYIARSQSTDVAEGLGRGSGDVVWQRIQNGLRLSRESAHADPAKKYAYAIVLLAVQTVLRLAPLTRWVLGIFLLAGDKLSLLLHWLWPDWISSNAVAPWNGEHSTVQY